MDKIKIANILLTRRCNLNCSYCAIVKNPKNKNYKNMDYYHTNELTSDEWCSIFKKLKQHNPDIFLILYGGEPFVYNEIKYILKYCNENNIAYTVITNNTDEIQSKIEETYKFAGKFNGFTSSIDPQIVELLKNKDVKNDIDKKTLFGFERLKEILSKKMSKEVVAEITVTKNNLKYLYDCVKLLSLNGIWSSITFVDIAQSDYYDFSNVTNKEMCMEKDEELEKQISKIIKDKDNLLIHLPHMLRTIISVLPNKMSCYIYRNVHNCTIDADGSFRLCLRIKGLNTPALGVNDCIDENGKITENYKYMLEKDYSILCKKCNWTCMLMSQDFSNSEINHSVEKKL